MNHEAYAEAKKALEKLVAKKRASLEIAYGNKHALLDILHARNEQGLESPKITSMLRVMCNNIEYLEEEIAQIEADIENLG